ncbi:NAD(P)-dependent oxidoreductase [Bailinhaonella thermotolerans]|uniref:NAD(P)-dependent oxidoreductase n=2 Tax=Bailinhaonella thermotolerans TaxID=1070861 RepID=A0A3A4AEM6_9ACTN|nr:NAD(P)-dependent oxidoreductase [Bailinhaonella thermotolerans]
MTGKNVTVIGLGPMGQAMARAYLNAGYDVTVWNRTASRADDLVALGAKAADNVEAALTANELVVLSLTDYAAMYSILTQAPASALAGRTIANLTSETPKNAREAAAWLADRGATQITGGVLSPPPGIGRPGMSTYYSGPRDAFEAARSALEVLTGTDYLGEDPGLAALYYQIGIGMFWTGLVGYVHSMALAQANGISATRFLPNALSNMSFGYFLEFYAPRIDAGDHRGDVERVSMAVASVEHVLRTAEDSGVDSRLPAAVLDILRGGVRDGRAADSLTALVEVFRKS